MGRNEGIPGLGSRLRQLRVGRGLTQRQLAEPFYSAAYISTIEAGKRRPSEEALSHFADRLGTDPHTLATGRPPGLISEIELGLVEARRLASVGKLRQAEKRFQELMKKASHHQLEALTIKSMNGLALCRERLNDPEGAIDLYEKAGAEAGPELIPVAVEGVVGQARCHLLLGDVRLAIHILEMALLEMQTTRLEDPSALLRIRASLVAAYFEAGLYDRAYENASEALNLAVDVEDPERLAWMYLNSAWALHHRGRPRDAHETLVRAEHFFGQLDLKLELGQARLAKGMLLSRDGDVVGARIAFNSAASTFRALDSKVNEARTLNELARAERSDGQKARAKDALGQAASILEKLDYPGLLGWTHRELGIVLAEDEPMLAEKALLRALDLYSRADEPVERAITYRYLGEVRDRAGNHAGACEAYRLGISVLEPKL